MLPSYTFKDEAVINPLSNSAMVDAAATGVSVTPPLAVAEVQE